MPSSSQPKKNMETPKSSTTPVSTPTPVSTTPERMAQVEFRKDKRLVKVAVRTFGANNQSTSIKSVLACTTEEADEHGEILSVYLDPTTGQHTVTYGLFTS